MTSAAFWTPLSRFLAFYLVGSLSAFEGTILQCGCHLCIVPKIELHTMKEEYKAEDDEACYSELARFLHYVNII